METMLIGDTEVVVYEPKKRIAVILCEILPHIRAKKNVSVHAVAKLEAKCWKLASKTELPIEVLEEIFNRFREMDEHGYGKREQIWDIIYPPEDWLVAYA